MTRRDDRFYLLHIRECLDRILRYTSDGKDAFFKDAKTQDAAIRNLQVLAESTTRLSDELKSRHPGIDWKAIRGFRNILVHDYLGVRLDRIWNIIEQHVPTLKVKAEESLADLGAEADRAAPIHETKPPKAGS